VLLLVQGVSTVKKQRLLSYFFSFFLLVNSWTLSFAAGDCDCEVITCGPCEIEVDIKFYTLKCNDGNRVKSCKKPICNPIDKKECKLIAPGPTVPASNPKKNETTNAEIEEIQKQVGVMVVAQGTALVVRNSKTLPAKIGFKVFIKDYIETGSDGKIKVKFVDDNIINVAPNSKITIEKMSFDPSKGTNRTMLNLIYGKIRSTVKHSYNGENYYSVKTPTAVVGVRGTDFVTSFFKNEQEQKVETKVETISGLVELNDGNKKQMVKVAAGTYASFVVAKKEASVFNENDISSFVAQGYLTPVFRLTAEELKLLEVTTNFNQLDSGADKVALAKNDHEGTDICKNPGGDFNQCVWKCENNPDGEKKCRTDLPSVNCVRKRCNANGKWAEDTRLPASFHDLCDPSKATVKSCDY